MRQRGVVSAKSIDCSRIGKQWVEKDNVCTTHMGSVCVNSKENNAIGGLLLFSFSVKRATTVADRLMENIMRWDELMARAEARCEFCAAQGDLKSQDITPEDQVLLCPLCRGDAQAPVGHWHCLEGAAWSAHPAVQAAVWRKLGEIEDGWAADTRDMMQVDAAALARVQQADQPDVVHRDSLGMVLAHGDTVVLVKDLPVKGAGFTAKRGTAVRNISLVSDNAGHIEGRVEGQRIVILTEFVKRK